MAPITTETFCLIMAAVYGGFGITMFNPLINWF